MSVEDPKVTQKVANVVKKYTELAQRIGITIYLPDVKLIPSFMRMNDDYLARAVILRQIYNLSGEGMPERFFAIAEDVWETILIPPEKMRKEWLKRAKETIFVYIVLVNKLTNEE